MRLRPSDWTRSPMTPGQVWKSYPDIDKTSSIVNTSLMAVDERIQPTRHEMEAVERRLVACGTCLTGWEEC
jgi:hypothetical protein